MTFTSIYFAIFVAITILIYYLPFMRKHQWVVLLISSYVFYLINSKYLVGFLLFTTAFVYYCGIMINACSLAIRKSNKDPEEDVTDKKRPDFEKKMAVYRKLFVAAGVLANFALLFGLKYFNVFKLGLIPLGISFYTFQATGYLIDVYREQIEAERNPLKFALFVSFFPQIVQGPISEFGELQHQLTGEHRPEWTRFKNGGELILWGLFKKLVIADRAVSLINVVSGDYEAYSGSVILFTLIVYALQIYADFSGGIDIARGIAEVLGIDMTVNFRRPYFAKSLAEYWRRWHISLGAWMKKYIFYSLAMSAPFMNLTKKIRKSSFGKTPAGRNLAKTLAPSIASFVVFMFVGIWHGSNTRYLGFGLWNGLIIMLATILESTFMSWNERLGIRTESFFWRIWQMLRTFVLVLIGYYFDVAPNFTGALDMMKRSILDFRTAGFMKDILVKGMGKADYAILLACLLILWFMSLRMEKANVDNPAELVLRHGKLVQWLAIYGLILLIIVFGIYGPGYDPAAFVYMQF